MSINDTLKHSVEENLQQYIWPKHENLEFSTDFLGNPK